MTLLGEQLIGFGGSLSGASAFHAVDPVSGEVLEPEYRDATGSEVDRAFKEAERAFRVYRRKAPQEKAAFLERIGEVIIELGDELIERCMRETGLPRARLQGERGRTVNQLRLFAQVVREGSWVDARIDRAVPDREPVPKPDLRRMYIPLGPVGIFGASNFPLAFSVAGGDTASALAAGCPVVVKAHPAHPGTSEMIGNAIVIAALETGMPEGVFSMLHGVSNHVGMAMVNHPAAKAIGFTGSFAGGKALYDAAVRRPEPIPVYAEMGSTNPLFILPGALEERGDAIAEGLVGSVTLGVGQFCTNPGLVFLPPGMEEECEAFVKKVSELMSKAVPGTMLTEKIKTSYDGGISKLQEVKGVSLVAKGEPGAGLCGGVPHVFTVEVEDFLKSRQLEDEVFGPSTLLVFSSFMEELLEAAEGLKGHLTATLHCAAGELEENRELVDILELKAGRLVLNGFPTGVEVCASMQHGGPFSATTDSRSTSVGTAAITRFARPVCYQGFPASMLPEELKDSNPRGISRLVDGNSS